MSTIELYWEDELIKVDVDYHTYGGYAGNLEEPAEEPEIIIDSMYVKNTEITNCKDEFYNQILEGVQETLN